MDTHLIPRNRLTLFLGSVAALFVLACDYGPYEPVGRREYGPLQGGGPVASLTIEGTWRRTLVFFDDFGFMHSSETTWRFDAGGSASRTIVTTNVTLGASDSSVTLARWRVDGTNLIIDFTAPSPGTITLDARVQGATLFLAGQEYQRIT